MTVVCKGIFVKNWLSHQNCETQLQGNNAKKCTLVVVGCCGVFYKILLVVKLEWYLRILYTTHIINKLETLMAIYAVTSKNIRSILKEEIKNQNSFLAWNLEKE